MLLNIGAKKRLITYSKYSCYSYGQNRDFLSVWYYGIIWVNELPSLKCAY